jgi:hypothetical protein
VLHRLCHPPGPSVCVAVAYSPLFFDHRLAPAKLSALTNVGTRINPSLCRPGRARHPLHPISLHACTHANVWHRASKQSSREGMPSCQLDDAVMTTRWYHLSFVDVFLYKNNSRNTKWVHKLDLTI